MSFASHLHTHITGKCWKGEEARGWRLVSWCASTRRSSASSS